MVPLPFFFSLFAFVTIVSDRLWWVRWGFFLGSRCLGCRVSTVSNSVDCRATRSRWRLLLEPLSSSLSYRQGFFYLNSVPPLFLISTTWLATRINLIQSLVPWISFFSFTRRVSLHPFGHVSAKCVLPCVLKCRGISFRIHVDTPPMFVFFLSFLMRSRSLFFSDISLPPF
jgi:hypothetical protein